MAMKSPNTRRSNVLAVMFLMAFLQIGGSVNAQESSAEDPAAVDLSEEFDEASFTEMKFETTIIAADPGPDLSGLVPKLPLAEQVWWNKMKDIFPEKENLKRCYTRERRYPTHPWFYLR